MQKIFAMLVLVLSILLPAQAEMVVWANYDLVWGGTNTGGGIVRIESQEGFGFFEAIVKDFSESYYWVNDGAPPPVDNFLTPIEGSGVEFLPWTMFMDRIEMPGQWNVSFIGSGYDSPDNPFVVTEFRENYWEIDDTRPPTNVPEPGTLSMFLLGVGLMVINKKRRTTK